MRALILCCCIAVLNGCAVQPPDPVPLGRAAAVEYRLEEHFRRWRRTPHRLGGTNREGIDCSAFVQVTYRSLFGIDLPRKTKHQSQVGRRVNSDSLRPGDLVFFKTSLFQRHVGIYVGNGLFIHASTSLGVTKTSLGSDWWAKRYWKAVRVLPTRKAT